MLTPILYVVIATGTALFVVAIVVIFYTLCAVGIRHNYTRTAEVGRNAEWTEG
jgi:hypothetical protein